VRNSFKGALAALTLVGGTALPALLSPAVAAVDASDPQRFIQTLTGDGFAVIKSGNRAGAKAKFRAMLAENVAVDQISDRLIRRWLPTITPAQKAAYKAALPGYVVGTYADRLFEYQNASVKVERSVPTAGGAADVYSQVIVPGRQPIPAVWSVTPVNGKYKLLNLRVAGINVAMAQAADFDSVIQRQGFDALIAKMKARG
jgi:phospholipid transport system substrate-binding protein